MLLQIATLPRKSAPWPPNIFDEDVSCTAPATRHASLQILFKSPTPPTVFEITIKPPRFADLWPGAESLAPATQNCDWTSESGPNMRCEKHFHFKMCFAPQLRALLNVWTGKSAPNRRRFQHFAFETCFALTMPCAFSTSQLPKVLRTRSALHILTSKHALRHSACIFGTSQRPRVSQRVLRILTCTCASRRSGMQILISPLPMAPHSLLSEPTFRPSGAKKTLEKKMLCVATFLLFRAPASFPGCVARVPVSLWGSGGWGCVRSTLRLRPQPSATVRNRSRATVWKPYGRAYGKFCKRVTFGGSQHGVASFRMAGVALCDIPTCFVTRRKSFCVAGAILLRRLECTV